MSFKVKKGVLFSIFYSLQIIDNNQFIFPQPIDESKEDFRMYLAKNGVLDALTKVLGKVQEIQPENPLEVRK